MKRLKREFEEQVRAELDADGNVRIGEVPMSPLDILQRDEDAYTAEYQRWLTDWLAVRDQRRASILDLVPDNRARFDNLLHALRRQQVAAFVGAGMSIASGLKSWPAFLRELREDGSCPAPDLEALLTGPTANYEAAADLVYEHMDARLFRDRMRTRFQVSPDRMAGSVRLLPYLFQRWVFTTNYDHILEEVYADEGQLFAFVLHGNQQLENARQHYDDTKPALLKLHGDERYPSQRVFRSVEYDQAYGPTSYLRRELGKAAGQRSLLFLGCSLSADRTMHVLHEAAQTDDGQPDHYAFLPLPATDAERRDRDNFLAARGIYPIWYDAPNPADHDESVEALLVGLLRELGKL